MPKLDLDQSPHSKVYAEIVRTLRDDPTLSAVVKTWSFADGSPTDLQSPTVGQCPSVTLRPAEGPERFYGPQGMIGPLFVDIAVAVAGTDAAAAMNLYWAIRRAFYPRNNAALCTAIHQALVAAGAEAHYVLQFTQGRYTARESADDGAIWIAQGQITLNVVSDLNP